ncbi:MAG TPA: helix-turn-helix domain-containing protein [Blastocatellia bacterium]
MIWVGGFPYLDSVTLPPDKSTFIKSNPLATTLSRVQVAGAALRISPSVLQAAIKQESQIYLPLIDHTHALSEQIAQATVCSQFHTTDQRLARWLLLARDRARYGAFNLTHEAMVQILGVSRSGVSLAAGLLQMNGLIRHARGRIALLNPRGT